MLSVLLKFSSGGIFVLVALYAAIKFFIYQWGIQDTFPVLYLNLIGERLSQGYALYSETLTIESPLTAWFYKYFYWLFGRSALANFITAAMIVLFQAFYLNYSLIRHKILQQDSLLPAYFYLLFSIIFIDIQFITPILLSLTFLIFALNHIIEQCKQEKKQELFFYTGFYIGIAGMFFNPALFFIVYAFIVLGIYSNTSFKKQTILIISSLVPVLIVWTIFYWNNASVDFLQYNLFGYLSNTGKSLIDLKTAIKIVILPSLLFLFGIFASAQKIKFLHYQGKVFQVMLLWLPIAVIISFSVDDLSSRHFLLFAPIFAYITTHFFIGYSKSKILSEVIIISTSIGIAIIGYYSIKKPDTFSKENLFASNKQTEERFPKNKKLMILGSNIKGYYSNSIASPFIDYNLSKEIFEHLDYYKNIVALNATIIKNKPDVIIDESQGMPIILSKIPGLNKAYTQQKQGVYILYNKAALE